MYIYLIINSINNIPATIFKHGLTYISFYNDCWVYPTVIIFDLFIMKLYHYILQFDWSFYTLFITFPYRYSADSLFLVVEREKKMDKFEQDLRFFRYELERERDPFRRNLLLREIARVERLLLDHMREERNRIDLENRNMEAALDIIRRHSQKKD